MRGVRGWCSCDGRKGLVGGSGTMGGSGMVGVVGRWGLWDGRDSVMVGVDGARGLRLEGAVEM
jgi:hypothetical protein